MIPNASSLQVIEGETVEKTSAGGKTTMTKEKQGTTTSNRMYASSLTRKLTFGLLTTSMTNIIS